MVLQAFNQRSTIADVIIINEAVALFAGFIPVPGGVGVTEDGAHRRVRRRSAYPMRSPSRLRSRTGLCTFYLPPIWGYVAMRSLQREGYCER